MKHQRQPSFAQARAQKQYPKSTNTLLTRVLKFFWPTWSGPDTEHLGSSISQVSCQLAQTGTWPKVDIPERRLCTCCGAAMTCRSQSALIASGIGGPCFLDVRFHVCHESQVRSTSHFSRQTLEATPVPHIGTCCSRVVGVCATCRNFHLEEHGVLWLKSSQGVRVVVDGPVV